MRDLAFIASFLAMLPPALRFAHVGAMVWTWIALISPNNYLYGFARGIPYNKVVVAIAAVGLVLDKTKGKFKADTHIRLLIAFLIVGMISYMFALSDKPRVDALADRISKEVLLCLFMVIAIRSREQIHSILIAMCMGMAIHGSIEGSKFITSGGGHILVGPGTIGDNNHFGTAMLLCIPLLIYLYRYSASPFVRFALFLATATNVVAIIATNSRGALLGLLAVGGMMFLRSKRKFGLLLTFLIIGGAVLAFAPERWTGRMTTISSAEQDGSFLGRVNSWKLHFLVALDRPLIGGGFSPMEDREIWESYLPKLDSLDFIPTGRPTVPLAAHSIYFQVLGDTGFIGLFLFLGLMFVAFRNLGRITKLCKGQPHLEWAYDLADAFRFSMVAYAVSGAALSLAYFELYYIIITLISLTRRFIEEQALEVIPEGIAILRRNRQGGRFRGTMPGLPQPTPGFSPPR